MRSGWVSGWGVISDQRGQGGEMWTTSNWSRSCGWVEDVGHVADFDREGVVALGVVVDAEDVEAGAGVADGGSSGSAAQVEQGGGLTA